MIVIKSSGDFDKALRIINDTNCEDADPEVVFIVPLSAVADDPRWNRLGESLVTTEADWLWVTDDNWDGDLSALVGIANGDV